METSDSQFLAVVGLVFFLALALSVRQKPTSKKKALKSGAVGAVTGLITGPAITTLFVPLGMQGWLITVLLTNLCVGAVALTRFERLEQGFIVLAGHALLDGLLVCSQCR